MPTLSLAMTSSRGMLPFGTPIQSQSHGQAGQRIEKNIKDIRYHEFRKLLETHPAIGAIISDLAELIEENEEDDYGILRPTHYAVRTTSQLILNSGLQSRKRIPYAAVTSDDAGGVRIEWYWHNRELRLIVPASKDGQSYIYHEGDGAHNIDRRVSANTLARWLDWLANV
jgi:hypothetical protein